MPHFDPQTLQVPDALARAVDLDPHAVLAVLGSGESPTGYLTALPEEVGPHRLLALWRSARDRVLPAGFRAVIFEPFAEPGAHDVLRDEPRVLEPPFALSITASTAERGDERPMPGQRGADLAGAGEAGQSDIEQTLTSPRDDVPPDALVDLDVPAEELIQLPGGPTARVDYAVRSYQAEGALPADLFMAYVQANDPAQALARIFLDGRDTPGQPDAMLDILREWHRRHGAEVLQVKAETGTLELWVEQLPQSTEEQVRLGREAQAFWPPLLELWPGGDDPGRVGRRLAGSRVWRFSI